MIPSDDIPDYVLEEMRKEAASKRQLEQHIQHPDPRDPDYVPKPATKPKERKEHNDGAE